MKCQKCGTDVENKDKFCPQCGASLGAEAVKESSVESAKKQEASSSVQPSQPAQAAPPSPQAQAPAPAPAQAQAQAPAPKKKNTCLIVAIILIILLLCCGATAAGVIYGGKYLSLNIFSSVKKEVQKGNMGQKVTCRAYQANMRMAIEGYYVEKEVYPTSLNELVPTYMPKMYTCPAGGTYTYDPVTHKVRCSIKGHTLED